MTETKTETDEGSVESAKDSKKSGAGTVESVTDCHSKYSYVHRTKTSDGKTHLTLDGKYAQAMDIFATANCPRSYEDLSEKKFFLERSLNVLKAKPNKGDEKNKSFDFIEKKKHEADHDDLQKEINTLKDNSLTSCDASYGTDDSHSYRREKINEIANTTTFVKNNILLKKNKEYVIIPH